MKITSLYDFLSENSYLLPLGIAGLTLIMLALTLFPADFLGESKLWSYDKLGHLVLFAGWTYVFGLYHHINWKAATNYWVIFLLGTGFGLLIEVLQYALPLNRHGDLGDFFFDMLGALIAIFALKKTIPEE